MQRRYLIGFGIPTNKEIGLFFKSSEYLLPSPFTLFTHFTGVTLYQLFNTAFKLFCALLLFLGTFLLRFHRFRVYILFKRPSISFSLLSCLSQGHFWVASQEDELTLSLPVIAVVKNSLPGRLNFYTQSASTALTAFVPNIVSSI